jgi:hypothetical protein
MTRRPRPEPTRWGTQRRLQALASRGWSPHAIQKATGIPAADITAAASDPRQTWPGLDRQVAAAYELLWNQQPPGATRHEQALADASRASAAQRNWAPPMAWDDDIIDLPDGAPAPGWKPPARSWRRSADLAEDAEFVREHCGYRQATRRQVAERLGVTRSVLAKACERAAGREAEPS